MIGERPRERDFSVPGKSVAVARTSMVATSHPQATLAALDVLRAGGNAVDAAIAAVALQCVIDPHMTGIGGDCFALYAPKGKDPIALNGSGRAPRGATLDKLRSLGLSAIPEGSPHAVTIPGAVDAWCRLSNAYGRLGLPTSLRPAIAAAEEGFLVTPRVSHDFAKFGHRLSPYPDAVEQYLPRGQAPAIGAQMSNPVLADTLRRVAEHGRGGFYEGPVAEDIVATLRSLGGLHSVEDFAAHASFETQPIAAKYRDFEILECPPNGQGLAALIIARILDGFDLSSPAFSQADRIHLLAEATKAAYRLRDLYIADPAAMTHSVDELLAEPFVSQLRARITMDRASEAEAFDIPIHRDTVYVAVVDADGNAISLINSLFFPFGSGIYAKKSGVLLQNRGTGFSLTPGHDNAIGPSKLPFHTIIPGLLRRNGQSIMAFGVMGGQYQATGHIHFLSQILDRGLDIQQASDQPRSFYTQGAIQLETTIPEAVKADLEARGHRTTYTQLPLGGCQAIWIDSDRGILWGASDHRKDGIALGY